ncbi:D-alanine--D-serine ligase VanG [Paenibacillus sp. TSA_86.1]|uniref:D-alanine--D-serine ligase VanG n=1 Tax=Paenibacillus sp. TSA_86.1 TaxID=3415649 RepID=UPI0040457BA3
MTKLTVVILFGGCSSEYEVSLQSTCAVLESADTDKYNLILIGITREGQWLRYQGDLEHIRKDTWSRSAHCVPAFLSPCRQVQGIVQEQDGMLLSTKVDVVFPVLHGKNGEDGTLQGLLELAGIPYVGCDTLSSALCMDKEMAHIIARSAGVQTSRSITVYPHTDLVALRPAIEQLGLPVYVKPARAGSSMGINKSGDWEEIERSIQEAFYHDSKVVIEENVDGFEVGCAVLGNVEPIVGEVDEIEISQGFFDYTEKYTLATAHIHLPARIDRALSDNVKKTALHLYQAMGCRGFARVDLFVRPTGELVFNEVNTIPGFTANSRYPRMLAVAGISYTELIDQLITLALNVEGR